MAEMKSTNATVRGDAKRKAEKATADGIKAREDALKGMVFDSSERQENRGGKKRKRNPEHEKNLAILSKLEKDEEWRELMRANQ